ncbi:hypothetical protein J3F83DRAFT_191048 [Trichoderma novae-zelandiae]
MDGGWGYPAASPAVLGGFLALIWHLVTDHRRRRALSSAEVSGRSTLTTGHRLGYSESSFKVLSLLQRSAEESIVDPKQPSIAKTAVRRVLFLMLPPRLSPVCLVPETRLLAFLAHATGSFTHAAFLASRRNSLSPSGSPNLHIGTKTLLEGVCLRFSVLDLGEFTCATLDNGLPRGLPEGMRRTEGGRPMMQTRLWWQP